MKKNLAIGFFALIFSFSSLAEFRGPFDPESVEKFLTESKIDNVDDFLKELPPELRENFSLVYESRNKAQHASAAKPRVILFSPDGSFYMSFAGDADVLGGGTVEMISQTDKGNFRFSTLNFDNGVPSLHKDIQSCKSCHGKVPRPIWDGYPKWPGAYGSDHDVLRREQRGFRVEESNKFRKEAKEIAYLEAFQKEGLQEGRYKLLESVPKEDVLHLYPRLSDSNMYFSEVASKALNRQIVSEFLRNPESAKYLEVIIDSFGQSHGREFYISPKDFQSFPAEDLDEAYSAYKEFKGERYNEFRQHEKKVRARLEKLNPGDLHPSGFFDHFGAIDNDGFAFLEFIGEKVGVDSDFWKSGVQGTYRQAGGGLPSYASFFNELVEQMVSRDPELEKFLSKTHYGEHFLYNISAEGKEYIKNNSSLFIGDKSLVFNDLKNRNPPAESINEKPKKAAPLEKPVKTKEVILVPEEAVPVPESIQGGGRCSRFFSRLLRSLKGNTGI
ncbi:MAG: hypothetical protein NXH75_03215 [Halobacteriovoraceae bacterium]|nr:hypothetical protein [Halobacteriovoraceae bacterium]